MRAAPAAREMDINPIIIDEHGAVAVDARIVIDSGTGDWRTVGFYSPAHSTLPGPAGAGLALRGGAANTRCAPSTQTTHMLQELVQSLSPKAAIPLRVPLTELPPAMLAKFTLIDYDREMAWWPCTANGGPSRWRDGRPRAHRGVRHIINPDQTSCEFSLVVADDFSGKGLGSRLMEMAS